MHGWAFGDLSIHQRGDFAREDAGFLVSDTTSACGLDSKMCTLKISSSFRIYPGRNTCAAARSLWKGDSSDRICTAHDPSASQ